MIVLNAQRPNLPPVRLYFDTKTGLLVRMVRYANTAVGRNPTQIDYADYREVDGVKIGILGFTTDRGPQVVGRGVTKGVRFTKGDAELKEFVTLLREKEKVALLVVDPARKFFRGDEDGSDAVSDFFTKLEVFARQKNCAVLVLHHLKRNATPRTISEVWQATGRAARRHHDTAYSLFPSAVREWDELGKVLLLLIVARLTPTGEALRPPAKDRPSSRADDGG